MSDYYSLLTTEQKKDLRMKVLDGIFSSTNNESEWEVLSEEILPDGRRKTVSRTKKKGKKGKEMIITCTSNTPSPQAINNVAKLIDSLARDKFNEIVSKTKI